MECVMIEKLNFSLVEAFYVRILVPSGSLSIISQRYYFEQFMTNTDIYLNLKRNIADRYNIFSQKAFRRIFDDLINFFFRGMVADGCTCHSSSNNITIWVFYLNVILILFCDLSFLLVCTRERKKKCLNCVLLVSGICTTELLFHSIQQTHFL